MAAVTRTLGPLHLEDLEPHRFEDLIRQLLYDFRSWQALESTGRSGSDDGFDARGWEVATGSDEEEPVGSDETAIAEVARPFNGRQWLIQCKREKVIGPSKIETYLRSLPAAAAEGLYGLIFVGACDFSKDTRDRFYVVAGDLGFEEAILWGKGEVEDQLFQPKNDHLLFAYFGVSLQIRRRSMRAAVRSRLVMKRRAKAALDPYTNVLIRSAADERYPYLDQDEAKPRQARGHWEVMKVVGCFSNGVHLSHDRHVAMINEDDKWDYAEHMNDGPVEYDNPWITATQQSKLAAYNRNRPAAFEIWNSLPDAQKAWYTRDLVLPYENIVDIDKDGDEFFGQPHVYADWVSETMGPFREFYAVNLSTISQWAPKQGSGDDETRIEVFPRTPAPDESAT